MFFSKMLSIAACLQISLAAVVSEDSGECAIFPREEASQGQHAMLQQSGRHSKGDVIVIDNAVAPSDSTMQSASQACDWRCYLERYPDLQIYVGPKNWPGAENHWNMFGKTEGRDCKCSSTESSIGSNLVSMSSESAAEVTKDPEVAKSPETVSQPAAEVTANPEVAKNPEAVSQPAAEVAKNSEVANNAETASKLFSLSSEPVAEVAKDPEDGKNSEAKLSIVACDWQCYLNRYPDLQELVGAHNVKEAEAHFNNYGKKEGRDCSCEGAKSGAVLAATAEDEVGGAASVSELTSLRERVQQLESQAAEAEANVAHEATKCEPLSPEMKAALETEVKNYEASEKFKEKISEALGETAASAGHVGIMKYLREKVLKPGFSILDLGAGAGGMLRFLQEEYDFGWNGGYYAKSVPRGSFVGVEMVPGWVKFAQENLKTPSFYLGDITDYQLPEPYASSPFDLVMLNDVVEHVQKSRYGCFFRQLDRVTGPGSLVYMHTPSPMAQLEEKKNGTDTQTNENVVPHNFIVTGMAMIGFELVSFEHDMYTVCGGEGEKLPRQLEGAHCYYNQWPKYTHSVFRKVHDIDVLKIS